MVYNRGMGEPQVNIETLLQRIAVMEQTIAAMQDENRLLREQLEQQQRTNARQAAPFRRRENKKTPDDQKKRPGRKPGHPGANRPVPEHVDQEIEKPLDGCPKCGEVHSSHPLQTSRGRGAAKVQLGPRTLAVAASLNKHFGLSMRRTCQVLGKLFGLKLSPGGLSQAVDRVADRLSDKYDALMKDVRGAPATFADETSWWVGEKGWWLWTFTTPNETLFHVEKSRGSAVVTKILGENYPGVLVSDCLATCDSFDCRKHKCIAHHLQAIAKAKEVPGHADSVYLKQWTLLFKVVIIFHRLAVEGEMDAATLAERRTHLERWIDRLLDASPELAGEVRIRNRLRKQRPHLIGCLYDLAAEPTNNRAERSLRPAVIARKISCGNKTDRGRRTWQILASLAATCVQRGEDLIDNLTAQLLLCAEF